MCCAFCHHRPMAHRDCSSHSSGHQLCPCGYCPAHTISSDSSHTMCEHGVAYSVQPPTEKHKLHPKPKPKPTFNKHHPAFRYANPRHDPHMQFHMKNTHVNAVHRPSDRHHGLFNHVASLQDHHAQAHTSHADPRLEAHVIQKCRRQAHSCATQPQGRAHIILPQPPQRRTMPYHPAHMLAPNEPHGRNDSSRSGTVPCPSSSVEESSCQLHQAPQPQEQPIRRREQTPERPRKDQQWAYGPPLPVFIMSRGSRR